jgi:hypothetical protein
VADTNNHAVRVIDIESGETSTLVIKGLERFASEGASGIAYREQRLEPQRVGAGKGTLVFSVQLDPGYKVNDLLPSALVWQVGSDVGDLSGEPGLRFTSADLPLEWPVTWREGQGTVTGLLTLYYCRTGEQGICLVERARTVVPIAVSAGGPRTLDLSYVLELERP